MSINDTVTSKKYVFSREQKTGSDGADVICCGRLFQVRTAATGEARSPQIESRVRYGEQTVRETKRNADAFETPTLLGDGQPPPQTKKLRSL